MVKKHNYYTLQFHFHDDLIDNCNNNNFNTYTAQYTYGYDLMHFNTTEIK